jgi:hypothetical protein
MDMKCVNGSQEETYIQMMIVVYKETTTLTRTTTTVPFMSWILIRYRSIIIGLRKLPGIIG